MCDPFKTTLNNEGDIMEVLDVLAREVGIPRNFLRLAGDGHPLCELHGAEVAV